MAPMCLCYHLLYDVIQGIGRAHMRPLYLQFYFNAVVSTGIEHFIEHINVDNSNIAIDTALKLHRFKTDWFMM